MTKLLVLCGCAKVLFHEQRTECCHVSFSLQFTSFNSPHCNAVLISPGFNVGVLFNNRGVSRKLTIMLFGAAV
jgi:hypothetical protein